MSKVATPNNVSIRVRVTKARTVKSINQMADEVCNFDHMTGQNKRRFFRAAQERLQVLKEQAQKRAAKRNKKVKVA